MSETIARRPTPPASKLSATATNRWVGRTLLQLLSINPNHKPVILSRPSNVVTSAFTELARFAGDIRVTADGPLLPSFRSGSRLLILAEGTGGGDAEASIEALKAAWVLNTVPAGVAEVWLAITGQPFAPDVVQLGVYVVPMHEAIGAVAGLPQGWRGPQMASADRVLKPAVEEGGELATLYAVVGEARVDAAKWVMQRAAEWAGDSGQLVYLLAEAGKGKSTLFASATKTALTAGTGPLPIYIPLRALTRGGGVGWDQIAASIGVVGPAASSLAAAVRAGLVTPFLDGLDEVAGRYDPTIVQTVADVVFDNLLAPNARVFLSGRTTEAAALDPTRTLRVGVELPDPADSAFRLYADRVVRTVAPRWPTLAARISEPVIGVSPAEASAARLRLDEQKIRDIVRWIESSFAELGKDQSLFFVQSLAFIGRAYQVDGNRPLVIESDAATRVAGASPYDACLLAAALACDREQGKVEEVAQPLFGVDVQLDVLTALALLASAPAEVRDALPSSKEVVQRCTGVDPTKENEEFVAMDRQMQKHALLAAGEGNSAGDWTPTFLSEWVRAALLVRAWTAGNAVEPGAEVFGIDRDLVLTAVAVAEKARLAYAVLFPDVYRGDPQGLVQLYSGLADQASTGSASAAANAWHLRAAEPDTFAAVDAQFGLPEFTDLTALEAQGVEFDSSLSAATVILSGATFDECLLTGIEFDECDLIETAFSGCDLTDVAFRACMGPVRFVGCTLRSCVFEDASAPERPAWTFEDCEFDGNLVERPTRIVQNKPIRPDDTFGTDVAQFANCVTHGDPTKLLEGDAATLAPGAPDGLRKAEAELDLPADERALRSVLRRFFPSWAGDRRVPQARPYIRTNALDRGAVPEGMPNADALAGILYSEGFSDGGRDNHVYAPWSQVGGATRRGSEMRDAYVAYLTNGAENEDVIRLRRKIDKAAFW